MPDHRNPQLLNRYSYAGNNPIRYNDPDGHCGPLCWAGIVLGLTGVALSVNASQPLPPERQPTKTQGLLGVGLLFVGLGLQIPEWLVPLACGDGNCANEAEQVVRIVCAGDCSDELQKADVLLQMRKAYEHNVLTLRDEAGRKLSEGQSVEDVARWAHQARRDIGVLYKNMTPPDFLEQIYARNIERYGDPLGPSIEWLLNYGKTWEDIIESATRPGGQDIIQRLIESLSQ